MYGGEGGGLADEGVSRSVCVLWDEGQAGEGVWYGGWVCICVVCMTVYAIITCMLMKKLLSLVFIFGDC